MGNLLTIRDVAQRLEVCEDTVYRAIKKRKLRAFKIGGWKIKPADVDAWRESQEMPKPEPARRHSRRSAPAPDQVQAEWEAEFERKYGPV